MSSRSLFSSFSQFLYFLGSKYSTRLLLDKYHLVNVLAAHSYMEAKGMMYNQGLWLQNP